MSSLSVVAKTAGCALIIALVAIAIGLAATGEKEEPPAIQEDSAPTYPRLDAASRESGCRMWSSEELKFHHGQDSQKPLLLAILGEVYDVGTGARFYSPGKGYHELAGGDNSRGFADMESEVSEDIMSKVDDLDREELLGVLGWHEFYRDHETYRFVGYVHGRYFDADGQPTDEHRRVQKLQAAQKEAEEFKKQLKKRFMGCNSRYVGGEEKTEIWCDDSWHPPGSEPLHVYWMPIGSDEKQGWCTCFPPSDRAKANADSASAAGIFKLVNYPECEAGKQRCKRKRTAPLP